MTTNIDRRQFLGATVAGASVLSIAGCTRPGALGQRAVASVGEAVLPSELGPDGAARVTRDFLEWVDGLVPGAERNHAYGSGDLSFVDALPTERWGEQLNLLDGMAREQFSQSFADTSVDVRRELVRNALREFLDAGLENPARAEHIAVALMAFFYRSAEATDLAYRASIKKQQCRPLGDSPNQPIALG